jgi:CRP-like cAMP-binding protein
MGTSLYLIAEGRVKIVTQDSQGEELVLNISGPGESIGEMSMLEEAPRTAGVVALEPTTMLQLSRDDLLEVLHDYPEVAMDIMRTLSHRLRFASTYIEQVIDISKQIAEGDYSFAKKQIQTSQSGVRSNDVSNEAQIQMLLSAFFSMVEGVQQREEELKKEIVTLKIQIDETRRKEEVESVTSSDFFAELKARVKEMREETDDDD